MSEESQSTNEADQKEMETEEYQEDQEQGKHDLSLEDCMAKLRLIRHQSSLEDCEKVRPFEYSMYHKIVLIFSTLLILNSSMLIFNMPVLLYEPTNLQCRTQNQLWAPCTRDYICANHKKAGFDWRESLYTEEQYLSWQLDSALVCQSNWAVQLIASCFFLGLVLTLLLHFCTRGNFLSPKSYLVVICFCNCVTYLGLSGFKMNIYCYYAFVFLHGISAALTPCQGLEYMMMFFDGAKQEEMADKIQVQEKMIAVVCPLLLLAFLRQFDSIYFIYVSAFFSLLCFVILLILQESPSYLLSQYLNGNERALQKCKKSLKNIGVINSKMLPQNFEIVQDPVTITQPPKVQQSLLYSAYQCGQLGNTLILLFSQISSLFSFFLFGFILLNIGGNIVLNCFSSGIGIFLAYYLGPIFLFHWNMSSSILYQMIGVISFSLCALLTMDYFHTSLAITLALFALRLLMCLAQSVNEMAAFGMFQYLDEMGSFNQVASIIGLGLAIATPQLAGVGHHIPLMAMGSLTLLSGLLYSRMRQGGKVEKAEKDTD